MFVIILLKSCSTSERSLFEDKAWWKTVICHFTSLKSSCLLYNKLTCSLRATVRTDLIAGYFNEDFNNDYFVHSPACVHCQHMDTQNIQMLFSFRLSMTFFPPFADMLTSPVTSLPGPGECLSEANWIFPHISINNYYAYNTGFPLPPHTNTSQINFIHFLWELLNSYSNIPLNVL